MDRLILHSHHGNFEFVPDDESITASVTSMTPISEELSKETIISTSTTSAETLVEASTEAVEQALENSNIKNNIENYEEKMISDIKKRIVFKSKKEKYIFFAFIIPPLAISFISMLHMISLFETSNMYWMAVSIAIAIELAAMSSLVALVTLDKLNKSTIWLIFGVLASLQILGNMYHTFINMSPESAQTILNLLAIENTPWAIRLVNFIVGGILPVISLTFVKGLVDYFKD